MGMSLSRGVFIVTSEEHPHEILKARHFSGDDARFDIADPPDWVLERLAVLRMLDFADNMPSYPSVEGVGLRSGHNAFWIFED